MSQRMLLVRAQTQARQYEKAQEERIAELKQDLPALQARLQHETEMLREREKDVRVLFRRRFVSCWVDRRRWSNRSTTN